MRRCNKTKRFRSRFERRFVSLGGRLATLFLISAVAHAAQLPPGVIYSTTVPNSVPLMINGPPLPAVKAVATDASGNSYVTGSIDSNGLTATPGVLQSANAGGHCVYGDFGLNMGDCADAFLAKFDSTGSLIFLTYLGGTGSDVPSSIAVDAAGHIYIGGTTDSKDFPLTGAPWRPGLTNEGTFLAEISSDGTKLIWSTVLNGSFLQLALAPDGFLYDLAQTSASNTTAVLTRLSANGQLVNASVNVPPNTTAIAVGSDGSLYIGGFTTGNDLTPTPGAWQTNFGGNMDGFVAKMNASLNGFVWLTLVGTQGASIQGEQLNTLVNVMQVASDGSVWFYGTTSASLPAINGAQPQPAAGGTPYLVHLAADGSKPLVANYLSSLLLSLSLTSSGTEILTGLGSYQATSGSPWPCFQGQNGFIANVDSSGANTLWATWAGPSVPAGPAVAAPNGAVVVAGTDNAGDVIVAEMTTATGPPRLVASCVAQTGWPYTAGPLAPGEVFSIYGAGFGPAQGVSAQPSGNSFGTSLGGVRVMVQGAPAPLLYASGQQINAIVPFGLPGSGNVTLQIITSSGVVSNQVTLPIQPTNPEVFTNPAGIGVVNQNGTLNSQTNPAHAGDTVSVWVSGLGQTNPGGVDGAIAQAAGAPPLATVTVQLLYDAMLVNAPISYVGDAPGLVSGVEQINFQLPSLKNAGPMVPVVLTAGGYPPPLDQIATMIWYQ